MDWDIEESHIEVWPEHWEVLDFFLTYISPMFISQQQPSYIPPTEINASFDLADIAKEDRKQMYIDLLSIQTGAIAQHVRELREKSK